MSGNALLDVEDEDSFMKKFILPENRENYGPEEMTRDLQQKPFIVIHPSPGVCVKTKTENGEKVFINVCTSEKIPAPAELSDAELLEIIMNQSSTSDYTIPMSIGNERQEPDKGGKPCQTYDVVLNKTFFDKCQKNQTLWMFTMAVMIEAVSNKFDKVLNGADAVTLKNRKVLGKLTPHRIEDREVRKQAPQMKKPLIEELPAHRSEKVDEPPRKKLSGSSRNTSSYVVLRQPRDGSPDRLIGLFRVPPSSSMKDISVSVGEDRVLISTTRNDFTYDVFLPFNVQEEATKCVLYKEEEVLRLDMPVDHS